MYYRMSCPRCGRRIEYTDIQVGHQAHCKTCNYEVILRGSVFGMAMYVVWAAALVFVAYGSVRVYRMMHQTHFTSNAVQVKQIDRQA